MILNGKEVKTRHCPNCWKLINKISTKIESFKYGELFINNDKVYRENLEIEKDENSWYTCCHCNYVLTNILSKAKEFIQLPEKEGE